MTLTFLSTRTTRRSAILGIATTAMLRSRALADDPTPTNSELTSETTTTLPAADLPSMNAQGHAFQVSATFTGNFASVPNEAPVYTMQFPTQTRDTIAETAKKLGIEGDVRDQGNATFSVQSDAGSLYSTPGVMQYISSAKNDDGDKPSGEEAIAAAREWLRTHNLLPANVGDGMVLDDDERSTSVIVGFQPTAPSPLISSTPNLNVSVGRKGAVLEFNNSWADLTAGDTFQLRGTENAWAEVESHRAWIDATLPSDVFKPNTTIGGSVQFVDVSLAYTTSGVPGEKQYLQPVYVFIGKLTADAVDGQYDVKSYVPALINNNQPVG